MNQIHYSQQIPQIVSELCGTPLLHDIATPAIDFMHGNYMRQESTEDKTA